MWTFKDIFTSYSIFLGRRFYLKEKLKFLLHLKKDFEEMAFQVNTTQSKQEFLGEKVLYHNLYAGNYQKSKVVLATYLDTPAYELGSKNYKPFPRNKSKYSAFYKLLFPTSILIFAVAIFYYLIYPQIVEKGVWSFAGILGIAFLFVAFLLIKYYRDGVPMRKNYVRNTSSILSMLLYAKKLGKNSDVAFAFLDGGTTTGYGEAMLEEKLLHSKAKVIYLDSVGGKGDIHIFTDNTLNFDLSDVIEHQKNTSFSPFADIVITSGDYKGNEMLVHTKELEEDIEKIEKRLHSFVDLLEQVVNKVL